MNFTRILVIILSIIGVLYGFLYYLNQFMGNQLIFWIFIPDCPLYLLFGLIVFLGIIKSRTFTYIASIGVIKYGLWTLVAFACYNSVFLSQSYILSTTLLTLGHIGMIFFGLLILPKHIAKHSLIIGLGWFLLNDYIDYSIGVHPLLPQGDIAPMMYFTFGASVILSILLFSLSSKISRIPLIRKLKTSSEYAYLI